MVHLIYILLDEDAKDTLHVKGETFKYLIKVRRHNEGDTIQIRYKKEIEKLYMYNISSIENRSLYLELVSSELQEVKSKKALHVGWCVIDTKSVEKVLPSLSEIGVEKITFINCDRSQKNFKIDFKRYERILEASMQQCGRSSYVELSTCRGLNEFITQYPETKVFDFCDNTLENGSSFETVLIGCEGGFSQNEKELLKSQEVFRLNTPMILRSESAVMAVASKILL